MMNKRELWDQLYQSLGMAFGTIPRINAIVEETDIASPAEWMCLNWAAALAPEPFPTDSPLFGYNKSQRFIDALKKLEELGYVKAVTDTAFQTTDKGQSLIQRIEVAQFAALAEQEPLSPDDNKRFMELLDGIIESIKTLSEPPTPRFDVGLLLKETVDTPPLWLVFRKVLAIEGFRQDAHNASWKSHDINAHAWEMLSLIWQGNATGFEDLPEWIPNRGFTPDETKAAFQEVVARDWIEASDEEGTYRMSDDGNVMRQEAEEATDHYFFAAWDGLSEDELKEISDLTTKIHDYFAQEE